MAITEFVPSHNSLKFGLNTSTSLYSKKLRFFGSTRIGIFSDFAKEINKNSKVLFHCYSGSVEFMNECIKMGWYIALGGVVTFKNAVNIKKVAVEVPLERLVLETDAPYLTPVPFRGQQNKPAYVKYVAEEIAKLKNLPFEVIADATTNNAEEFFNI